MFTQALANVAPEPAQQQTGPVIRSYAPGYRPWIAFQGTGAWPGFVQDATSRGWEKLGPMGLVGALAGGAILLGVVGLAAWMGMGYYVGKKLGTKSGWFWGLGGPLGIAGMTAYRQYKGRISGPSAVPNRRRRRSHRRAYR